MAAEKKGRAKSTRVEELKLPPQSLEAEQALLGAVLLDNSALPRVLEVRTRSDDFYREVHGLIFRAMLGLFDRGEPVDLVTLREELGRSGALERVGGAAYLAELADAVATAANVEHYATIVQQKAILRRLIQASVHISERSYAPGSEVDEVLDEAERSIFSIREGWQHQSIQPLRTWLKEAIGHIEALMNRSGGITGVPTGFRDLDHLTGGFQPGDLIIVAGRPSMGKTALALNLATQAAIPEERDERSGDPYTVAFFSLEMSREQVLLRLLCSLGKLDLRDVRTGRVKHEDFIHLTAAASKLNEASIFVDDTPALGVMEMRAKARRLKSQLLTQGLDLGLVIVDYLQLMQGRGYSDSRVQEISEISRSLKALAKELHVPVVALSQLARRAEERASGKPALADLRESGALEQDADVVAFVYRGEVYKPDDENLKGRAELIVGKQRNGPTGTVHLTFLHPCARFGSSTLREEVYF